VKSGQLRRLLPAAFCHDRYGIWHIVFNMLFLYWFGCTLESMYGSREFLFFYLTSAVVSSLAFVALDLYTGSRVPAIGASGAVLAVTMLYTMHFPFEEIRVFWFFPIQMRWIMLIYVIWDLHPVLLAVGGDHMMGGVAHAAHLGGLAFGFLYYKYQWRLDDLFSRFTFRMPIRRSRPRLRLAPHTIPEPMVEDDSERVDALLAKIFESGEASLTDEERAVLKNASERRKNRANRNG
jgi:membrane associated rhomboid family serine protease